MAKPIFNAESVRTVGGYEKNNIIVDAHGKLWLVNCETGVAKAVQFEVDEEGRWLPEF